MLNQGPTRMQALVKASAKKAVDGAQEALERELKAREERNKVALQRKVQKEWFEAAEKGDATQITKLMAAGVDIESTDYRGLTARFCGAATSRQQ